MLVSEGISAASDGVAPHGRKGLRSREHGRGPWHLFDRDMQTRRAYPDETIVYYALVAFP